MAVEIPVVVDMDAAFQDAAKQVPSASKPLVEQVERVSQRMSNAIQKAQKTASKGIGGGSVDDLDQKMSKYMNTARLAAQQMLKIAQAQGKVTAGRLDIKALSTEISVLAAKWNSMKLGSKFDADGKLRVRSQEILDKMSRLTSKSIQFGDALSTGSKKASAAVSQTNAALTKQSGIWAKLSGYVSGYMLLFTGMRFAHNIRETTAELEMQRVALGGIIQDTETANDLFRQIKAAALRSPFEIKDLVSFTKQLSAYRIETDKLFDVTMRLADVSAGLGIDMSRLVLAYGQVRAASVLRGQELRQFTEAGIPLVDLLAKKFRELGREGTTTADVFELISKRAVPFKMIEEIFNDMTNAGGMFYKMQEKQSETLKGQWMKLRDAITIMYDEMGNTEVVHGAMTSLINTLNDITKAWRETARWIGTLTGMLVAYKAASLASELATKKVVNAEIARAAILKSQAVTMPKAIAGIIGETAAKKASHIITKRLAVAQYKLAAATTLTGKAFWGLYAALMSNPYGAAAAAVVGLGLGIYTLIKNSQKAELSISELGQSVERFRGTIGKQNDTRKLIDIYEELSAKTGKTREEQEKLARVTRELAKQYPSAIDGAKKQNEQLSINISKIKDLTKAEQELELARLKRDERRAKKQKQQLEKEMQEILELVSAGGRYQYKGTEDEQFVPFTESQLIKLGNRLNKIKEKLSPLKSTLDEIAALRDEIGDTWVSGGGYGGGARGGEEYSFDDDEQYKKDPFITRMENRIKFMKDFKKGYDDLLRFMSSSSAVEKELGIMKDRGLGLSLGTDEQKRAAEDLSNWYKDQIDSVVKHMNKSGIKGGVTDILRKEITGTDNSSKMLRDFQSLLQSLWDAKTDFDVSQEKKNFEDALKRVKDEIKRSETARNFYQDILDLTGDKELATSLSVSVYGGVGQDFKDRLQSELNKAFMNLDWQNDEMADWDSPLAKAIESTDWNVIMENLDRFPKEWQKRLKEMKEADEKFNADYLKDLYKTYEKEKTFDQRRRDIRNREAQKRTEIEANKSLSEDEKTKLTTASINKEAKDIAKVNVEELKNTYEWGKAFEDLDRVGSKTLVSLRQKVEDIIEAQKDSLDPADYKALVDMLNKIKDTQIQREPVGSFASAARRTALIAPAVFSKQGTKGYDKAIAKIKEFNEKAKETDKIDIDHLQDEFMNSTDAVKKGANAVADYMNQWKGVIDTISDIFDLDEIPILGETVDGISSALGVVAAIIPIITVETVALSAAANSIPFVAILTAIVTTLGAIIGMIKGLINAKVERLNKKIEAQKQYVDDLERSYDRLEKAMEKAFGTDYAENYAKALENLAAQQKAYEEQARLEREKGKKADEEKIKDYSDAAKDASEKIDDMKGKLAEFFTDMDLTSAAKDFAQAWIDAYKEFGSTTDAMKEKFNEMIENMVVNSLAAKLIQTILDPVFQAIDKAAAGGLTAQEIGDISAMIPERMKMIDGTMMTLMNQLTAAGVNLRQQVGSFTGISRNIATASEDSINGLAAGINTQNFYMQHIDMNVALILSAMTGGASTAGASVTGEVVDPYKDQMLLYAGHIPAMDQNLAELLAEVRKVIKPRGTTATHYVATNL